ncbi:MAG: hypothetical protein KO206_07605 [Methanomicrobiaceae archaeon]|uniref:Uncharacterized protein n=1 Tax=hydrocarbon metagenome TaxID=938273 RepID=A0A0W8FHX4_9ZZZZ|nr:hypothetical protein [Methanomicrobiaceae archaeon]MDD5420316.1 hypothetical protein [Methanomicrobiaceae archaeon]
MTDCEIHLNRRGINTIEPPAEVTVAPGETLDLRLINHGSPLHITLSSSNSGMFTDFFHENLFVRDEDRYAIPIREDAYAGFFDVSVITGYGACKASFRVIVQPPARAEEPVPEEARIPVRPARRRRFPLPAGMLLAASLLLYSSWLLFRLEALNYLAFLALLLGVFAVWYWQRS